MIGQIKVDPYFTSARAAIACMSTAKSYAECCIFSQTRHSPENKTKFEKYKLQITNNYSTHNRSRQYT